MKRQIAYSIEPSFDESGRMEASIAWDDHRKKYCVDAAKGHQAKRRRWLDPNGEIDQLMLMVEQLKIPLLVDGPMGLDGTLYRLIVGGTPSTTLTWWQEIPPEWSALLPIVRAVEAIADDTRK